MAIEDNGLEIKRFDEILQEINDDFSTNAGVPIDTSSDSIASIMNSASAKQLSEIWELIESVNDSTDILKAEGKALDNLALQVGLTRIPAQQSAGVAWFTGDNGTTIGTTAIVSTSRGDEFTPSFTVDITPSSCLSCLLEINTVLDETEYQVTVDGTQFNYTSLIGATEVSIINGLATELTSGSSVFTTTIVDTDKIRIDKVDLASGNTLNVTATTYISFSSVTSIGLVVSVEYGFIEGAAHSLNTINTPVNGWDSIDNPSDMTLGRFEQTDDELRTDILNNYEIKDSVTYLGIKDALEAVSGVTSVDVFDNEEFYTQIFNSTSVFGKSYMCTVDGGINSDIAQTILETKPAGIKTSGDIEEDVVDDDGQIHTIRFSRSTQQFFYMSIVGTKYLEETYPPDGDDLVKQSCLLYGDSLGIGEDVIPQRFIGAIYDDVAGIDALSVEVAYSTNPSLPNNDPSLVYTPARVPMNTTEVPLFATTRMEVSIV